MEKYLREVEDRLLSLAGVDTPSKWKAEDYVGGGQSALRYLDLKIPKVRSEYKRGFSFSQKSPDEQWRIWDYIWRKSKIFEVMLMPSYWAASRPLEETFEHREHILKWQCRIDNWAHSDEMSAHYARLLEHDPEKMLPIFKQWNTSSKPWYRRQSLVGLLFYSRFRKRFLKFDVLIEFVDRHLADNHYYVQKAVGWTLREIWNVYPKPTFAYLKKNARKIPPAAWTAATEKLSAADKKTLMQLRRGK